MTLAWTGTEPSTSSDIQHAHRAGALKDRLSLRAGRKAQDWVSGVRHPEAGPVSVTESSTSHQAEEKASVVLLSKLRCSAEVLL